MENDDSPSLGDRRVTLEQLRAFVLVARGGGFNQVGAEMGRSQSAVTQSLKRLEDILGCRLVERRQGHIVGLTAEGKRFEPAASEILARTSEAIGAMQQPQMSGRVRIGVPEDFKIVDLHGAISRCADLNRHLKIEVISALSSEISKMLRDKLVDIAIIKSLHSANASLEQNNYHVLRKENLCWVGKERRSFSAFAEIPLVIFPSECAYRAAAIGALTQAGKSYYPAYVSSSYDNLRAAVSAGLGIGILPKSAISKDHGILSETDGFPLLPDAYLTMVESSSHPIAAQLGKFLRASTQIGIPDHVE